MFKRQILIPVLMALSAVILILSGLAYKNYSPLDLVKYYPESPSQPAAPVSSTLTPKTTSLKIMIGGDIMLDRRMRMLGDKNGYDSLFTEIAPLFKSADIAVANLEGPITNNPSKTLMPDGTNSKDLSFTFSPVAVQALKNSGLYALNLANNHTNNFGREGFNETRKHLSDWGLKYFGTYWNASSTELAIEKNGIKVAFVGYHEFAPDLKNILADIRRLTSDDYFVIVVPHWGDEYDVHPNELQHKIERLMIAAGAKAIVGSHPHVVQDYEWVGNIPVFFSLGNLIFDQYWSKEVMTGEIVELDLGNDGSETWVESVKTYEISLASKTGVTVNLVPTEILVPAHKQ